MNTLVRIGQYGLVGYVGYTVGTINERLDTLKRTAYARMMTRADADGSFPASTTRPYTHLLELDDDHLRQAVTVMSNASKEEVAQACVQSNIEIFYQAMTN